jgi:hypothetical protein
MCAHKAPIPPPTIIDNTTPVGLKQLFLTFQIRSPNINNGNNKTGRSAGNNNGQNNLRPNNNPNAKGTRDIKVKNHKLIFSKI